MLKKKERRKTDSNHICHSAYLEVKSARSNIHQYQTDKATPELKCSSSLNVCNTASPLLFHITIQVIILNWLQSCSQSLFTKQTWTCVHKNHSTESQTSFQESFFMRSHLCIPFLWWYPATMPVISLPCTPCPILFSPCTSYQFFAVALSPVESPCKTFLHLPAALTISLSLCQRQTGNRTHTLVSSRL